MQTKSNWKKDLKANKIRERLYAMCIYSVNKRAKNYREQSNKEKKKEMYLIKRKLLSKLEHEKVHIHKGKQFYYYELGGYKFHIPAAQEGLEEEEKYAAIEKIKTNGEKEHKLVSLHFIDKVLKKIDVLEIF